VLERVIGCPFLIKLYYAFQSPEKLYLVLEFVQGGDLFYHLEKHGNFSEDRVRFIVAEMIIALEQLHKVNLSSSPQTHN
jgi:serine/threonine protein kinase